MLTLILLFVLMPYLLVGSAVERRRYAVAYREYAELKPTKDRIVLRLQEVEDEFASIPHKSYCFTTIVSRIPKDCENCTPANQVKFQQLKREKARLQQGSITFNEPSTRPLVVAAWPVYAWGTFLKGGAPPALPVANEDYIKQLESLNKIGE